MKPKKIKRIRLENKFRRLLKGIDVGPRYPIAFESPGFVDEAKTRAMTDCTRALGNGSMDEAAISTFSDAVIGAVLGKTEAYFNLIAAHNEETLAAFGVAQAEQLAYQKAIKRSYEE